MSKTIRWRESLETAVNKPEVTPMYRITLWLNTYFNTMGKMKYKLAETLMTSSRFFLIHRHSALVVLYV